MKLEDLKVGMALEYRTSDGDEFFITIQAIENERVTYSMFKMEPMVLEHETSLAGVGTMLDHVNASGTVWRQIEMTRIDWGEPEPDKPEDHIPA